MGLQRIETVYPRDVHAAVTALRRSDTLIWLDSSNADASFGVPGRNSVIGWNPAALLTHRSGTPAVMNSRSGATASASCAWRLVREALRAMAPVSDRSLGRAAIASMNSWSETDPTAHAFPAPGLVGYFGYELGEQLERLPSARPDDLSMPRMWLALLDHCVVLDHFERRAWIVSCHLSHIAAPLDPRAVEQEWLTAVKRSDDDSTPTRMKWAGRVVYEQSADEYQARVQRALDYISAGDIYQVNLCQRIGLHGFGDPLVAYGRLRRANPAPFGALLHFGDHAVISSSPELFLRLSNGEVLTSPIKGTRPRSGDLETDRPAIADLLGSAKDAAELAMIVDLHRNDLGRVCETGSIKVLAPRRMEAHPRVFHTVADVVGRLRPECDAIDLLAATFPAGSVTGVPKIRAQQIIHELEPVTRGVFAGAIGHIGIDGSMTMNVAIRTLQVCGDRAALHVGGGIVADSDPRSEYEETLAKARGIIDALTL